MKVKRTPGPGKKNLEVFVKGLNGVEARAGWIDGKKYPTKGSLTVAYIAAIQEVGAPSKNIPARPFMRPTIVRNTKAWKEFTRVNAKKAINGEIEPSDVIGALAGNAVGEIQKSIRNVFRPPLKDATVDARARRRASGVASSKPLIDTGTMLNSVTWAWGRGDDTGK